MGKCLRPRAGRALWALSFSQLADSRTRGLDGGQADAKPRKCSSGACREGGSEAPKRELSVWLVPRIAGQEKVPVPFQALSQRARERARDSCASQLPDVYRAMPDPRRVSMRERKARHVALCNAYSSHSRLSFEFGVSQLAPLSTLPS